MKSSLILAGIAGAMVFVSVADAQHRGRGHHGPQRAMMMLQAADANGDNNVTRSEVDSLQSEMFEWMDRNGDGFLTREDRSPIQQRLAEAREDNGGSERRERRRGHRGGPDRDSDGDGRISRSEFLSGADRVFEQLDTDNNSVITAAELDAAVEARRERRESRRFWWRN